MTIEEEANAILGFFNDEWGQVIEGNAVRAGEEVNGLAACKWMRDNNLGHWTSNKWQGFFVKLLAQEKFVPGSAFVKVTEKQKYRIRGEYLWDIRIHDVNAGSIIILNDALDFMNDIIENGGMGLIILNAGMLNDWDDSFRQEIETMKGGPSDYELRRRAEGKSPWMRVKAFRPWWGDAVYVVPDDLQGQSWLSNNFKQGKNENDEPRKQKYFLDLESLPGSVKIKSKNFNLDIEENKEYFEDEDESTENEDESENES